LIVLDRLFSPVEARTTVALPRDAAFRTIADPRTYPTWLVGAQRIRRVDPTFPAPAAEFEHSVGPSEGATIDDASTSRSTSVPWAATSRSCSSRPAEAPPSPCASVRPADSPS
jgi:hypothetical protein